MQIEILTREELLKFKTELIQEIKQAIKSEDVQPKQWLRSFEVRDLLKISSGTLQNSMSISYLQKSAMKV